MCESVWAQLAWHWLAQSGWFHRVVHSIIIALSSPLVDCVAGRTDGWMDGCLHANANDHDDDRSWHSLIDQANRIVPFVFVASARNVLINLGARGEQNPRVAEIRLTGLLYANGDDTGWLEHAHSVIHPSIRPVCVVANCQAAIVTDCARCSTRTWLIVHTHCHMLIEWPRRGHVSGLLDRGWLITHWLMLD